MKAKKPRHRQPSTEVGIAMELAINLVGAEVLAVEIGAKSAQAVSNWRLRESVPIEFCVPIEAATKRRVPARSLCTPEAFEKYRAFIDHFYRLEPRKRPKPLAA
jgi:hypothetical protein